MITPIIKAIVIESKIAEDENNCGDDDSNYNANNVMIVTLMLNNNVDE